MQRLPTNPLRSFLPGSRRTLSASAPVASSRSSSTLLDDASDADSPATLSASAYLAAQAELEEGPAGTPKKEPNIPELREPAWDGEETRERMITRILADQYKPLRIKGYQKPTQKPSPLSHDLFADPPSSPVSSDKPPVNPWDVTFKPPDHYNPSVAPGLRSGAHQLPHLARTRSPNTASSLTVKLVGGKPTPQKARLASAYERSLDYRGGVRSSSSPGIAVPVHEQGTVDGEGKMGEMRAWEGFIEEKIKQAHRDGLFRNIKGRGKPIPKDDAESNPFISRDDFLINRIMKTQDAAPPWVEVQKELESSLAAFRTELRANWTRRALRIRSSEGLTPAVVREVAEGWKDPEWEAREKSYHDTAIKSLNDLVRKYNVIAPYHVRRPLLTLRNELDSAITLCAPSIATELQRRLSQGVHTSPARVVADDLDDGDGVRSITADEMGGERKEVKESMWKALRRVVVEVLGKGPDEPPKMRRRGEDDREK